MTEKAPRESVATQLWTLAMRDFAIFQGEDRRIYMGVADSNIAYVVGDSGGGAARDLLSRAYFLRYDKVAGRSALSEALDVLRAQARAGRSHPVHVRTARVEGAVYIDLGYDGELRNHHVWLTPVGWSVSSTAFPEWFRRTELTGPIMALHPYFGADDPRGDPPGLGLENLQRLLNVKPDYWQVLVGWMVAVLLDAGPVPALLLTGEQGTGKTSTARALVELLDPSSAPVIAPPRDAENWAVTSAARRVVCIDNLSTVPDWFSDALCRAVTGDGYLRRQLYSDDGVAVTKFRRAIILTSIDAGAIRGDLAERLVPIELDVIDSAGRRSERELRGALDAVLAPALCELLDLASECFGLELDGVIADNRPRMADFADVLARVDRVTGWSSLDTYRSTVARTLTDAIMGDNLAEAISALVERDGSWRGSAKDLLTALAAWQPIDGRGWPKAPRGLAGALKRLAVPLRAVGIDVRSGRDHTGRWISLDPVTRTTSPRDDMSVVTVVPSVSVREKEGKEDSAEARSTDTTVTTSRTVTAPAASTPSVGAYAGGLY